MLSVSATHRTSPIFICDNAISRSLQVEVCNNRCVTPSFFPFSIAVVCLTPASRRDDVGQAAVPSLDAQIAESRRGFARRATVFPFLFLLFSMFSFTLLLCGFLAFQFRCFCQKARSPTIPPRSVSATHPTSPRHPIIFMSCDNLYIKGVKLAIMMSLFFFPFLSLSSAPRWRVDAATWGRRQCRRSTRRLLSRDGDLRAGWRVPFFLLLFAVVSYLSCFVVS